MQATQITQTIEPVSLNKWKDGSMICNLGQNMVGTFFVEIPVRKGRPLTITLPNKEVEVKSGTHEVKVKP